MAKFNAKDFFLQKGEKVVLGLALAGFAGLTIMGITSMLGAESPTKKTTDFKNRASQLKGQIDATTGDPGLVKVQTPDLAMRTIDPTHFRSPYAPFETVDQPSSKRDNPAVLGITDAQVDLVRAPIKAFDVVQYDEGKTEIGVLFISKAGTIDTKGILDLMKKNNGLRQPGGGQVPPPAPAPVPNPMQPPPPAAPAFGGRGERGGGTGAPPEVAAGGRSERTVRYVPLADFEKELAKPGALPAFAVYPLRMVVVQASFPLKEQLEVIKRALRLKDIATASAETASPPSVIGPTFDGFEVERRVVAPNGQDYGWASYDHVGQYINKIGIRKFADQSDDGFLTYFLRYDQKMVMPLPALAANMSIYPNLRLDSIIRGVNKIRDAGKPKIVPSDLQKKLEGKDNPFAPSVGVGNIGGGGALNNFTGSGDVAPAVGRGGGREEGKGPRPPLPGTPAAPEANISVPANMPELEHMLLRFLDVDIRPGFTYQYRVRVKMKNPNFGRKDVNRPDDAKTEVLMGPWVTIANEVGVPADRNLYAGDPVGYTDRVKKEFKDPAVIRMMDNKNGEIPVVQFQNWTEKIAIEPGKTEPAGYWVVHEAPVNRGEYIGRRAIVPLPMWSSEKVAYILQELPKYKVFQAREQPKGLLVDFTSNTMMVDYDGGRQKFRTGDRSIEDDADVEMMLLQPDGKVLIRNSGTDRVDPDRSKRDESWRQWLERIKKESENVLLSAPIPGGGGPPGPGG